MSGLVEQALGDEGPGRHRTTSTCCPTSPTTGTWRSRSSSCRSRCSGGRSGIPAPNPAAAATSPSACSPRSRRRTRSAACCSSTSPTTCCGPGRGSWSAWPRSIWSTRELSDIQKAFPKLDPSLLGHDIAYPGDAQVPARRLDGPDGRRPDRRQLLDDPDPPQLGRVLPGARLLPPLHQDRTPPRSTTCWRDGSPRCSCSCCSSATVFLLDTAKDSLRPDPAGRRGHRTALPGALVLVAGQRLVRDRGDDQLVRRLAGASGARARTAWTSAPTTRSSITIAVTTVSWVPTAFLGPQTDRKVLIDFYQKVRPFGPGWRPSARRRGSARPRRARPATTSRSRCSAG